MPARSKKEQQAAGSELRRRRRGAKRQKKATQPFGSAKLKDLKDIAGTKHKGLPTRKKKKKRRA